MEIVLVFLFMTINRYLFAKKNIANLSLKFSFKVQLCRVSAFNFKDLEALFCTWVRIDEYICQIKYLSQKIKKPKSLLLWDFFLVVLEQTLMSNF